jgi:hypothetical protein
MNGLHISGMKLSSPAPNKKPAVNVTTNQIKPKDTQVNKTITKKPTIPPTNVQKPITAQKKELPKKIEDKTIKK